MSQPTATLHPLPRADGSASYTTPSGYSILASLNGPIEAQRRDELPEEAFLEVIVRPESGSGGPRDRHIESLLRRTLLPLLRTKSYPRALLQLTLQILATPSSSSTLAPPGQADSIIPALPHLVNAGVLAFLDSGLAMRKFCVGVCVAAPAQGGAAGDVHLDPTPKQVRGAKALHAIVFACGGVLAEAEGEDEDEQRTLLLAESSGSFTFAEYEGCADVAWRRSRELGAWIRDVVGRDVEARSRWRGVN